VAGWTLCWYVLLLITEVTFIVRYLREPWSSVSDASGEEAPC
jgi:hypothetical protein